MDQNKAAKTIKRMEEARAIIVRDYPFFGHLALGLKLVCASCGTACTDGEHLIVDPSFSEDLKTIQEMEFLILHEVLHCVLEHCYRMGSRHLELYNIACDIVVNSTILGIWGMQTFCIANAEPIHLAPDGKEGREYQVEEVYQMLLKHGNDAGKHFNVSGEERRLSIDRHDVWKRIEDETFLQARWNKRIQKAVEICQSMGNVPPEVRHGIELLHQHSKVDWKQALHDFLQYDTYDYSFAPPDRRFHEGEFFLPAYNLDEDRCHVQDIWVCIDTSASVTEKELSEALFEVQDAMRQAGLTGMLSFFDDHITEPIAFTTEEELKAIVPKGGRWTSYLPIFELLEQQFYPNLPKAILIFTDGYVLDWPKEENALGVPVVWLISDGGNKNIPWGKVIRLEF